MIRHQQIIYALLLWLIFSLSNNFAQGWEYAYPNSQDRATFSKVVVTPDSHFVAISRVWGDSRGFQIIKTDQQGNLIWNKEFTPPEGYIELKPYNLLQTTEGDFIVGGRIWNDVGIAGSLTKLDSEGNLQWSKEYPEIYIIHDVLEIPDGGFLLTGRDGGGTSKYTGAWRIDEAGELLWGKSYGPYTIGHRVYDYGHCLVSTVNDNFLLLAGEFGSLKIYEINASGGLVDSTVLANPNQYHLSPSELIATQDGGYLAAGWVAHNASSNVDTYGYATMLWKLDNNLQTEWLDSTQQSDLYQKIVSIAETPNGDFYIGQYWSIEKRDNTGQILCEIDTYGDRHWYEANIASLWDEGAVATSSVDVGENGGIWLAMARLDSNCIITVETIEGQVKVDSDGDCLGANDDPIRSNWLVELNNGVYSRYQLSDSTGNYRFYVNPDDYFLTLHPPIDYWASCSEDLALTVEANDTIIQDLYANAVEDCPFLTVDLAAYTFRPCFDRSISIQYSNLGPADQEDAYIRLLLDSQLMITTASLPYVDLGNELYEFFIGDIASGETGQINLDIFTDCETEVGDYICIKAEIFPSSDCEDNLWNGAIIEVRGQCLGETVRFEIENIGLSDMLEAQDFIVIEDDVMLFQGVFDLNIGQVTTQDIPNEHGIYYLRAEQEDGYPFGTYASDLVAYCQNPNLSDPFSNEFFDQFPFNDDLGRLDEECVPLINSFDPNQKLASPRGYGEEHYIEKTTDIEYQIDFQNTGTDTAYLVVIKDTLSPNLDITSLRLGASSHPYQLSIEDERTLVFTFNDINLLDSTNFEERSKGFLSYNISLIPDLPEETRIENRAAIYFDFNPPIITNTTWHTIGSNFIIVSIDEPYRTDLNIQVYPNPARAGARLQFQGLDTSEHLHLKVFNTVGQKLGEWPISNQNLDLETRSWTSGIYYFQIWDGQQLIGTGKIVLQ